jgi:Cof subfamily protein (haloacid dehalogenase superfamily)
VIESQIIRELIDWNEREHIDIFFEGKDGLYFPPEAEFKDLSMMEVYFKEQGADVHYYEYGGTIEEPIEKFSMWYDNEHPPLEYRAYLEQHFNIIERAADFWEVIPKGYSKATGIDQLLEYLDCSLDDTISFGDSANDISMLEHTKESVVMGDSEDDLKEMATYVTSGIDQDGIYHAMKHFNLI